MANIIYGDAPLFRAGTQATKIATASRLLQESDWVNQQDPNCYIFRLGFETTAKAQQFVDAL